MTSHYRYDLAPYTWSLVQSMKKGRAIFTQPPMPIKCAGAPQKAMYLSCYEWEQRGVLKDIEVDFHNAGAVLFGVSTFVPPLMEYVKRYDAHLHFNSKLVAIDGDSKIAWFEEKDADGHLQRVEKDFDFLHVVPPQSAPDFVRESVLANAEGWVDVDLPARPDRAAPFGLCAEERHPARDLLGRDAEGPRVARAPGTGLKHGTISE